MVYAPREESDVATVMEIVKAGGWWVGGVDLGAGKAEKWGIVKGDRLESQLLVRMSFIAQLIWR